MPPKITPGILNPRSAAALTESLGRVNGLELSGLGAGVARVAGPLGQYLQLPPVVSSPPTSTRKYPLGNPCLVADGYGNIVGIAQRWEHPDGSVHCVVSGICEGDGCGSGSVPGPDPEPEACVTVSGTVVLQPEASGVFTTLLIVPVGPFISEVGTGAYSVDLSIHSASVAFTCEVPAVEQPRDVYASLDGGATWFLTGSGTSGGFMLTLPTACEPVEVLWELWEDGLTPPVVVEPPLPIVPPEPPPP